MGVAGDPRGRRGRAFARESSLSLFCSCARPSASSVSTWATGFLKKFYGWYLGRGRFPRAFKAELDAATDDPRGRGPPLQTAGSRSPLSRLHDSKRAAARRRGPPDLPILDLRRRLTRERRRDGRTGPNGTVPKNGSRVVASYQLSPAGTVPKRCGSQTSLSPSSVRNGSTRSIVFACGAISSARPLRGDDGRRPSPSSARIRSTMPSTPGRRSRRPGPSAKPTRSSFRSPSASHEVDLDQSGRALEQGHPSRPRSRCENSADVLACGRDDVSSSRCRNRRRSRARRSVSSPRPRSRSGRGPTSRGSS